ncbi:MAG: lytic transglycosylase domain-containing protein [Flavobacteriales bacterium]|nr:lytic transglycosylase domain-containing protein [Flavobacteriales bacterium]
MKKLVVPIIILTGLTVWFLNFSGKENKDQHYEDQFANHYKIFAINSPVSMSFAGEVMPLDIVDIRERLDRELMVNTYWQSQTLLLHKRANRWFPVIEPILAENNIPDDFKYLCVAESGLDNVVSPARAVGFWQFLKDTGREYGLEINDEVDERYSPERSTEAACKYLRKAYDKYGSWSLAAASYNMGINGLDKQMDIQKVNSYYDLLLGEETGRYVFRIAALKEIMNNSTKYGFHFRPKDLYPTYETKTIEVDTAVVDMSILASDNNINYKILKILNPWLRKPYLKNKNKKTYQIKLPADNSTGLLKHSESSTIK